MRWVGEIGSLQTLVTRIQLSDPPLGLHFCISTVVLNGMLLHDLHACLYQASLDFGLLVFKEAIRTLLLHDLRAKCSRTACRLQRSRVGKQLSQV